MNIIIARATAIRGDYEIQFSKGPFRMFSTENARTKAYSSDLRWRMVHQRYMLGCSYRNIAERLSVDPSTVYRTVKLFEETGTVCSVQGCHENTGKKLSRSDEIGLLELVLEHPSMYLHELQNALLQATGTDVSTATICRFLHDQGFSCKKLSFRAQQRNDELKAQFQSDISLFEPHMFIFIDETGSDKRTALRKFGYSFKGMRAVTDRLLVRGKRFSTIAAMCMDGIIDVHITTGSVDGETFCEFIERCLQPQLLPYDGTNPRSVVILDNASIHHVQPAIDLIQETGAIPVFLPPYSPDFMPIEECFSKVKSYLRGYDPLVPILEESEMEELILAAFTSITADDCQGWMRDCGYNM